MDYFSALSAFIHSAEARSFTAAGTKLGLSSSAIGKAITRLEAELGVQLFHRSTRAMTLTAEGKIFLQRSLQIFADIEDAKTELMMSKEAPQGKLRVGFPQIASFWMPLLVEFQALHPLIELELDFSDHVVNIIEDGFDAVIRIGTLNDSRLKMRILKGYKHRLVAAPTYLANRGQPESPSQLTHHACLRYRYPNSGKLDSWPFEKEGQPIQVDLPQTAIVNSIAPLKEMAIAGIGIALLPNFITEHAIQEGLLTPVLDTWLADYRQVSLLWPSSRQTLPKIRVFVDFISEKLGG